MLLKQSCGWHAGGADQTVRLWDAVGGALTLVNTLHTKATPVYRLAYTPRNCLLAAGAFTLRQ